MAFKTFSYLKDFLLALFSSLLLILSFPKFDLGFLAWIGLVPLLISIDGKRLSYAFLLSLASGSLFFLGVFYWILVIPNYTALHHALLAIYLGSYFGLFGLTFTFLSNRLSVIPTLFAAPFIWVSLEYIRGNLSFLSLPWAFLGHSQYQYPVLIQIASLTGTYSISFLIIMVNAAFASLLLGVKLPQFCQPIDNLLSRPLRKRGLGSGKKIFVATTASLVILTFIYGYFILAQPITGNRLKISLVQGNIEQRKKWDPDYAKEIIRIYKGLSQEASKGQPALIIWPETATPSSIIRDPEIHTEIKKIASDASAYLLLGSAQHQKFKEKGAKRPDYFNSAYLIHPEFRFLRNQRYDKIRLFPFGEYLPYKEIIPWAHLHVLESGDYSPGKKFTILEHPDSRFAATICWENIFPDLVRQFVKHGAQFVVNMTNEAHFGQTAAPHQLAAISVFRAVENRVFVVRCANTGISCIIDPNGRIVDRVKNDKGQDIFVRGVLSGWVIPLDSKTLYTQYGDWFVWVAMVGSVVFLAVAVLKVRKK
jgi:apolipoprotein N-acyltransferase